MFDELQSWIAGLESSNYTVVQTIIYALLVLLGLYLLYRWLKVKKISIDTPLMLSSLSYIILGGLLHVVYDTVVYIYGSPQNAPAWRILLTTPQVYILILVLAMIVLYVSYKLQEKKIVVSYVPIFAGVGTAASVISFVYLVVFGLTSGFGNGIPKFDLVVLLIVVGIAAGAVAILWAFLHYVCRWKYVSHPMYLALMASHFLDSSATAFAIDLHPIGYIEQHVVGGNLIALTGTAYSMFLLKLAVLIPSIWILEKFRHEKGMEGLWHLIIFAMMVVGLGPGIRDLFRMVLWI